MRYLNSDEILGNNPININPLIVNNNIAPEEIKQKVNIIIEQQQNLIEKLIQSNANQDKVISFIENEQKKQSSLLEEIKQLRLNQNNSVLTQNTLLEEIKGLKLNLDKILSVQEALIKEVKEIRDDQGKTYNAIEKLLTKFIGGEEKEKNSEEDKNDEKGKNQDQNQKSK